VVHWDRATGDEADGDKGTNVSITDILERTRALLALDDPTQEEVFGAAERLAQARLAVRDLPAWRPARTERLAIAPIERAHQYVLDAREARREGAQRGYDATLDDKKRLAKAQLAEMLVARRSGFASYDDYRRACRPRTSFTATAFNRLRSYRELAAAEAGWQRIREALVGDLVIDLTGDSARVESTGARASAGVA
jgi:hypothetical protein